VTAVPASPAVGERIARFIPGLAVIRRYQPAWLRFDVQAGIVLTALLIPQGLAYGGLAGLPPVTGIYATMIPLLVYAILGPSRILVMGPDSAVAPLVAATIIPLAGDDVAARVGLAGALAVTVGILCLVGGLARLGFVTDLLSKPVRIGYLAGIAIVVIADQIPTVLGISIDAQGFLSGVVDTLRTLGEIDLPTAVIGLSTVGALFALRALWPRAPGALLAVVAGIVLVTVAGLEDQVATVGAIPQGLPSFALPTLGFAELQGFGFSAVAIALVAFADTGVLSRSYAGRLGDRVNQNQELFALGAANTAAGFFGGFPVSSSASRTAASELAGARTQLTGIVAAAVIGLVLLFATGIFANLPSATLAAIVIVAVSGLVDIAGFRRLAQVNRPDLGLAVAALLGVTLIGVMEGIGIAVALSVGTLLWRAWHPYTAILSRVPGRKGYHDLERHPEGLQVPGLVLYRFDAPLFFANADAFRAGLLAAVAAAQPPARRVVVAAEPITDVDSTAADMLSELLDHLDKMEVGLVFAELKGPVKDKVVRYGLDGRLATPPFPSTLGTAVDDHVAAFKVHWVDWEDADGKPGSAR
jgi:high affinity sulfate transporter 1